ncbi:interleukin-34-like [Scleropages formosus]|uniref:Interleukin 34 n=1 Tax=Scleropages formosus TaxID=113540 RepID=A0A8C9RR68_SCLFO|nr:interleukin-34-like [Scleropages formosus]
MARPLSWLLMLLLVLIWVLPIAGSATLPELCKSLNTLKARLHSGDRRQFMKHNFPLNYTVQVRPQEVFRLRNISKLMSMVPDLEIGDLQELWLLINQEVLKKVLQILPERHPSRHYVSSLQDLLRMVQQVFQQPQNGEHEEEERDPLEQIEQIWAQLRDPNSAVWKLMSPKALVDNCYRTMHCLFSDCFPSSNSDSKEHYCSILHWRKGKKQQTKDA